MYLVIENGLEKCFQAPKRQHSEENKYPPSPWDSPQDPSGRVHIDLGIQSRLQVESPEPPADKLLMKTIIKFTSV